MLLLTLKTGIGIAFTVPVDQPSVLHEYLSVPEDEVATEVKMLQPVVPRHFR